jgi:1-aminocyclopropane-1-carboxylate deaminase/D-cysteine desulfhydrase-like pyridoxal-dependent ACC family enzyme
MENVLHFANIFTQTIHADWLQKNNAGLDILRLDKLHEVVSGNKWFKLKYYLDAARHQNLDTIATFGGAFSNHIVATAFACHHAGLKSIGIIRGEEPPVLSHTLQIARRYGMELEFVTKALYNDMALIKEAFENVYWIEEGGYGILGMNGAKEILAFCDQPEKYSHIVCAVGTGTMMAGLIGAADFSQTVTGVSVMKGNYALIGKVEALLSAADKGKSYLIKHDYHFGGYAKHPPALLAYMNDVWMQHRLPTDIVYTAKTFYAAQQMIMANDIPKDSNVLMVHSGGLQGNLSLPEKTLYF